MEGQRSEVGKREPGGAMLPGKELPGCGLSFPLRLGPVQELGLSRLRDHFKRAYTRL